jgi:hypothetical protein
MIVIFLDSYFGLDICFCSLHPSQTNKIATINNPKLISPMGGLDAGTLVKSSGSASSGGCETPSNLALELVFRGWRV